MIVATSVVVPLIAVCVAVTRPQADGSPEKTAPPFHVALHPAGLAAKRPAARATANWEMGPFVKRPDPGLSPTPDSTFHCPVLGQEVRWEEQNVYNPAAVVRDGKVYILYRTDDKNPSLKWGRTCRCTRETTLCGI